MAFSFGSAAFKRGLYRLSLKRWQRAARRGYETRLEKLRAERADARKMKTQLDQLIHIADERLALPMIGSQAFDKPFDSDWAWRPELWRGALPKPGLSSAQTKSMLGREVTLFHDCQHSELTLRQIRNRREADLAPYGLQLDVFKFDGSFLSVVVDLPEAAAHGLLRKHLLRIQTIVEFEKPLEIFARINIKHGPNTEQIVRELPLNQQDVVVEFDLAYSKLNEKRVERIWLDLIFEGPEMNQIAIRDLTFSRRPRAEL
ncbi:DUF6478 family protein [Lentibacter sp. XHP0401]|jgi:Family of unknown function (DUF6478)|uniref:DUF6478 family protein n=1 Tax=Lentibacter sp. XHP0401 TaxID=2984334 RepID=UPI0021E979B1|nr:DUF6478 family protein [Lentibacter sp. XHP0401]MCV2893489.1 DUF6478 family protein [Lentibacter sp. XHP0401]